MIPRIRSPGYRSVPPILRSRCSGFSLIELLVVITIIAVLASMLMGAVGMVRRMAAKTAATNGIRTLGLAVNSFLNDNDGILPGPMAGGNAITYNKGTALFGNYLWSYFDAAAPPNTPTLATLTMMRDRYREAAGYQTFFVRNNHYFPSGAKPDPNQFDPCGYVGVSAPHSIAEINRVSTTIFAQDSSLENYSFLAAPATALYGKYITLYYDFHVGPETLPFNKMLY